MNVSAIGVGNMGSALADGLLAANHSVTVWNRSAKKCTAAVAADAVRASDLVIFCLSDSEAVSALLSNRATAEGLPGRTVLQLSPSTPEQSTALSHWARKTEQAIFWVCRPTCVLVAVGSFTRAMRGPSQAVARF